MELVFSPLSQRINLGDEINSSEEDFGKQMEGSSGLDGCTGKIFQIEVGSDDHFC
jgi:hypothetical protein